VHKKVSIPILQTNKTLLELFDNPELGRI